MSEKPSSRKRHRWSLEPGDLVRVLLPRGMPPMTEPDYPLFGMILSVYSANVYEGSSAEVLVGSEKLIVESRYLIRIQQESNIST